LLLGLSGRPISPCEFYTLDNDALIVFRHD